MEQDKEYLRVHEAAGLYPFSMPFLRKLIWRRMIPVYRVGRCVWLKRAEIEDFIASGRIEAQRRGGR